MEDILPGTITFDDFVGAGDWTLVTGVCADSTYQNSGDSLGVLGATRAMPQNAHYIEAKAWLGDTNNWAMIQMEAPSGGAIYDLGIGAYMRGNGLIEMYAGGSTCTYQVPTPVCLPDVTQATAPVFGFFMRELNTIDLFCNRMYVGTSYGTNGNQQINGYIWIGGYNGTTVYYDWVRTASRPPQNYQPRLRSRIGRGI